jgi:hypothetical protein
MKSSALASTSSSPSITPTFLKERNKKKRRPMLARVSRTVMLLGGKTVLRNVLFLPNA